MSASANKSCVHLPYNLHREAEAIQAVDRSCYTHSAITRSHYVELFARKRTVKGRNPSCIFSIRIIERLGINSIMRRPIAHWTLAKLTSSNVATYRDERLKTDAPRSSMNLAPSAWNRWRLWVPRNPVELVPQPPVACGRARRFKEGEEDRLLLACDRGRPPPAQTIDHSRDRDRHEARGTTGSALEVRRSQARGSSSAADQEW